MGLCRTARYWILSLLAVAAPLLAQDSQFPREHHPWGRFPVKSWKLVRTTSETLDEKGRLVSSTRTDTRTTLIAADDASYTLQSDITVEVAGRRIAMTPQTARHGYYGEPAGRQVAVKLLGEAPVKIDGREIPCEVRQVAVDTDAGKLTSTLYYTSTTAPFVLRRESSLQAAENKRNSSLVEVIALDLPQRVRGEIKPCMYVKTTQNLPQGKRVTLEVQCDDVPGGVVSHFASETDVNGRVVRRSTLEILDYGFPTVMGQPYVLPRRPHRAKAAARRMEQR
jgi:hypothetical protein